MCACWSLKPNEAVSAETARSFGSVEMARGEFTTCEYALRQHALSVEPSEFQLSLREDGFWLGLSWCEVAKLVHVQMTNSFLVIIPVVLMPHWVAISSFTLSFGPVAAQPVSGR